MTVSIQPKSHAEKVALFRAQVLGPILARDLSHGDLAEEFRILSQQPVHPPWLEHTRTYAVATLERWYYMYRKHGLEGLKPVPRSDRGYAQVLTEAQRTLILGIAQERPEVSVSVLVRTLIADGRLGEGEVSEQTIRRLLADEGLDRKQRRQKVQGQRRRWQAAAPDVLWHADVCHGPSLRSQDRTFPLRVHAILDDASRFIVGIRAFSREREIDMLELLVEALRQSGPPRTLYLDNGATYRGAGLHLACARLGIQIIHAQPYDPQARGKMERFWRTLRAGCLDHIGTCASLHDVQVRLGAFIDRYYHPTPHSSLIGRCPRDVYADKELIEPVTDEALAEALTFRDLRRIRRDGTLSIGGIDWEIEAGHLAGQKVTVARTLFAPRRAPWVETEERTYALKPVDPVANASRPRSALKRVQRGIDAIPFDPAGALLDQQLGRKSLEEDT